MPARYYFDLESDFETIHDREGVEAGDLNEAIRQAELSIREVMEAGGLEGIESRWELIIRDATGLALRRLPTRTV